MRGRGALRAMALWPVLLALWPVLLALGGCGSEHAWREVRPEGWGLAAQLPCRPDKETRNLALPAATGPAEVAWEVWSCVADGRRYALGSGDLGDPARVAPALQALWAGLLRQGATERGRAAAQVPGMTPQPASGRRQLAFAGAHGEPAHLDVAVFAHGARIFQAMVMAPGQPAAAPAAQPSTAAFFAGLGLRP